MFSAQIDNHTFIVRELLYLYLDVLKVVSCRFVLIGKGFIFLDSYTYIYNKSEADDFEIIKSKYAN